MDPAVVGILGRTFAGRRVLVTGDTGFKGSWLCAWLVELGAQVHGYALPPEREDDHFARIGLASRIAHEDGDVRDFERLLRAFHAASPEVVFHLAAQSLVRASYDDPKRTLDTNIGGSVNVLEAVRHTPSVRSLVYVTSDKCYRDALEPRQARGYRETDALGGHDPYSASKAAAELVFSAYGDSFFASRARFGAASVRAGNAIGGGDQARDRIVPDAMRALLRGEPVLVRNPLSTRPWQHVLDPLAGYLRLAARLMDEPTTYRGAWNFGPAGDDARTVSDLVQAIVKQWGTGAVETRPDPAARHEAARLWLDSEKARRELGWSAQWDFERSVAETVAWHRRVAAGEHAADVTSAQIRAFVAEQAAASRTLATEVP